MAPREPGRDASVTVSEVEGTSGGGGGLTTGNSPRQAAEPPEALSAGYIRGYAAMWLLGLGFLWWPVLLLRAVRARLPGARPQLLPLLVAGCLLLSLLIATVSGAPLARIVGASYNLSVWTGLVVLTAVRIDLDGVARGIGQLAGLQSLAVLAALATYPLFSGAVLPASRLLPRAVTEEPALESFANVRLIIEDYFGDVVLRAAGFFGNATWAGALAALGLLVTPQLIRTGPTRSRISYGLLCVLDVVVLYLSYSRNTWIAVGAGLMAMGVVALRRARRWFLLTVLAASVVGVGAYVATSVDLGEAFESFNSVREGSLGSRTAIYTATWQAFQDSPFPLLGSGIKDRVPGLVASLGTHSGYLGTLYRGGILAAVFLLLWLCALAFRSWQASSPIAMGATVFAGLWFVAEDIDAGHLAPLALLLAVAALGARVRPDTGRRRGAPVGVAPVDHPSGHRLAPLTRRISSPTASRTVVDKPSA
jgi:hypothetical protein